MTETSITQVYSCCPALVHHFYHKLQEHAQQINIRHEFARPALMRVPTILEIFMNISSKESTTTCVMNMFYSIRTFYEFWSSPAAFDDEPLVTFMPAHVERRLQYYGEKTNQIPVVEWDKYRRHEDVETAFNVSAEIIQKWAMNTHNDVLAIAQQTCMDWTPSTGKLFPFPYRWLTWYARELAFLRFWADLTRMTLMEEISDADRLGYYFRCNEFLLTKMLVASEWERQIFVRDPSAMTLPALLDCMRITTPTFAKEIKGISATYEFYATSRESDDDKREMNMKRLEMDARMYEEAMRNTDEIMGTPEDEAEGEEADAKPKEPVGRKRTKA